MANTTTIGALANVPEATPEQMAAVKKWLSRAYKLELEIIELERARAKTMDRLTSITQAYNDVGGENPSPDPHKLDAVGDVAQKLDARIEELTHVQMEIVDAIDHVDAPAVRAVLLARYINGLTWEAIGAEMRLSRRWVLMLHNDGLRAIVQVINII